MTNERGYVHNMKFKMDNIQAQFSHPDLINIEMSEHLSSLASMDTI